MDSTNNTSRTHEERWQSAATTYSRFVPTVEPERVADSFSRRLGPLGTFAFEAVGDMWNRPQLSRRDRSLLIISTLAAQARDEELVVHTEIGLRHGLTRIEIEEILPHVVLVAGFPTAMAAARHIDEGLRNSEGVERLSPRAGAESKSDARRDEDAAMVLAGMRGHQAHESSDGLAEMTDRFGYLGEVAYRFGLGEIWARPQLSRRDRSIVTISMLTTLGATNSLVSHVRGGLNQGLGQDEIEEVITHLGLYAGTPRAFDAMETAREVFAAMAESS